MENTSGRKSKYAAKKQRMSNGTYHGSSPFYNNNPEWQYLKPLSMYPHLRMGAAKVGTVIQTGPRKPDILSVIAEEDAKKSGIWN